MHQATSMTDPNNYNPYPMVHTIRCPKCSGPAIFHLPFRLLNPHETDALTHAQANPTVVVEQWGGWHVVSYFHDLYPWKVPASGGYRHDDWGVCQCPQCGYKRKHQRQWPDDAYFVCEVEGKQLWAWTREHVATLKHYIESKDRNIRDYRGCGLFLHHIPTVFLRAKNRTTVVRKLQQLLET